MSLRVLHLAIIGLSLATPCPYSLAQEPQRADDLGAKALFYNASGAVVSVPSATTRTEVKANKPQGSTATQSARRKPQEPMTTLALRVSVLLVSADGGTREVKPSHQFGSGDRIKLAFNANRAGYFYLATVGSSGRVQVLSPRRGEPAVLEAGYRYQFPTAQNAYFKFDQRSGKEELWAVLSDEPLSAIDLGAGRIAQVQQPEGVRVASLAVASVSNDMSSKDLVLEEDAEAAYASIKPSALQRHDTSKKPRVMVKLVLDHQ